jgi:hypothetical protein
MRSLLGAAIILCGVATSARCDEPRASGDGVTIGPSAAAIGDERCVEVEIGGEKAPTLDCLNRRLRHQVDRVQPTGNLPPLDASSPAVRVGGFNQAGLREQFGSNFGHSVVPFRPPPTVFANPTGARR